MVRSLFRIGLVVLVFIAFVIVVVGPPQRRIDIGEVHRMDCASNLRQIGLACKQYAQDNGKAFPPNFAALYPDYVDSPKLFSCPSVPSEWPKIRETGKARNERTSYVYVAGLTDEDDAACVLAYERVANHGEARVHVLFLDMHVEWAPLKVLREIFLADTRARAAKNGREIRLIGE